MTSLPSWDDPRYSRQHATSPNPPHLGHPPIGDYMRAHQAIHPAITEQFALSQVWPLAQVTEIPGGMLEDLAERTATDEVEAAGKRAVVPLRFWWWPEDIPTEEGPPTPGVRMLAVVLTAPNRTREPTNG